MKLAASFLVIALLSSGCIGFTSRTFTIITWNGMEMGPRIDEKLSGESGIIVYELEHPENLSATFDVKYWHGQGSNVFVMLLTETADPISVTGMLPFMAETQTYVGAAGVAAYNESFMREPSRFDVFSTVKDTAPKGFLVIGWYGQEGDALVESIWRTDTVIREAGRADNLHLEWRNRDGAARVVTGFVEAGTVSQKTGRPGETVVTLMTIMNADADGSITDRKGGRTVSAAQDDGLAWVVATSEGETRTRLDVTGYHKFGGSLILVISGAIQADPPLPRYLWTLTPFEDEPERTLAGPNSCPTGPITLGGNPNHITGQDVARPC